MVVAWIMEQIVQISVLVWGSLGRAFLETNKKQPMEKEKQKMQELWGQMMKQGPQKGELVPEWARR